MFRVSAAVVALFLLCAAGVASAGEMRTVRSRAYQIHTDIDRDLAVEVGRHMDAVSMEYSRRFAGFRARGAVNNPLYVFASKDDYVRFLGKHGIDGTGSGGMFFVRSSGSGLCTFVEGQSLDSMFNTLRHEGFHQFAFYRIGGELPTWVDEGLAEYFGESIMVRNRLRAGQVPPTKLRSVVAAIEAGRHIPFERLLNMDGQTWSQNVQSGDATLQYDQSWAIVHFLVNGEPKLRRAFEGYLKLVAEGRGARQAFAMAFGNHNYAPFEKAWIAYMKTLEPNPLMTAQHRLEFLAMGMQSLRSDGVNVESVGQLKTELQSIGYSTFQSAGHGAVIRMFASDNALFEPPAGDNPKRRTKIEMFPAKDGLMPEVLITGLKSPVRLTWMKGATGQPVSRVVFK